MSSLIHQRFQGFFVAVGNIVIIDVLLILTFPLHVLSPKIMDTSHFIYIYVQNWGIVTFVTVTCIYIYVFLLFYYYVYFIAYSIPYTTLQTS